MGVEPKSNASVLIIRDRKGHTGTQRRRPFKDRGRGWTDDSINQGLPRATRSWKGKELTLSEVVSGGAPCCDALVWGFSPPEP